MRSVMISCLFVLAFLAGCASSPEYQNAAFTGQISNQALTKMRLSDQPVAQVDHASVDGVTVAERPGTTVLERNGTTVAERPGTTVQESRGTPQPQGESIARGPQLTESPADAMSSIRIVVAPETPQTIASGQRSKRERRTYRMGVSPTDATEWLVAPEDQFRK